jgi:hypothetical protein
MWSHTVVNDVEFYFHLRVEAQKEFLAKTIKFEESLTGVLVMKIVKAYKAKEWKDGGVKLETTWPI